MLFSAYVSPFCRFSERDIFGSLDYETVTFFHAEVGCFAQTDSYLKCLQEVPVRTSTNVLAARQWGNGNETDTLLPVAVRVFKAGAVLHLWQDVWYLVLRITQDAFKHCSQCFVEWCSG